MSLSRSLHMIKAVLFDFDETLQNRTEAFEVYMTRFFARFFPEIKGEELEKRKEDMRRTGNGGYVNRVEWYGELIKLWSWENAPSAESLADHYEHTFGDCIVMYPESKLLFKELKKRGYIVGVVTNGPAVLQKHKMNNSGLMPLVDLLVVSGDYGVHKPNPELLRIAAKKLNLPCEECVYVGDHPVNDIQTALNAGMKAIRMNAGWFKGVDLRSDVPVIENIIDVLNVI